MNSLFRPFSRDCLTLGIESGTASMEMALSDGCSFSKFLRAVFHSFLATIQAASDRLGQIGDNSNRRKAKPEQRKSAAHTKSQQPLARESNTPFGSTRFIAGQC